MCNHGYRADEVDELVMATNPTPTSMATTEGYTADFVSFLVGFLVMYATDLLVAL